jgi:NAD(P)-dependent dehydrogenase (short-subunit alcohol dehydrogenase family)
MSVMNSFSLAGRTALVTGGARGIGRALAVALAEAGANVAVTGRDPAGFDSVCADIEAAGVRSFATPADVSDRAAVEHLAAAVEDGLGPVDILVNNAGACVHRPALEVPDEEWQQVFDVNVTGVWLCSTVVGRRMVERKRGAIVNIGSISAMIVNRPQWQPGYNASKAAVHQLTRSLAAEWAPHNVRVNALAPGYVKTEMAPVDEPRYRRHWIEDAAMQRYALPQELGASVVYLASDASSFMTGHILVADGGYTLW